MSDLGQDKDSLELKLLEIDHSIAQSELAKKSINLDVARITAKLKNYAKSQEEIDRKIEEYRASAASIKDVLKKLEK